MIKRLTRALILAAMGLAAVGTATAPAHAYSSFLVYYTTYYSDATYTDVVGFQKDKCPTGSDAGGMSSAYYTVEIYGECIDGRLYPYDG